MLLFTVITTALALLAVPIYGVPTAPGQLKTVIKHAGPTNLNSYIVKLKDDVSKDTHLGWLASVHNASSIVTHGDWDSRVLHGYAGTLGTEALSALLAHPDVEYIEEDAIISLTAAPVPVLQTNAPWGLGRINQIAKLTSQNPNLLNFTYRYNSTAGSGVDIYVVDTGIYLGHSDFNGRAIWGGTFGQWKNVDDGGHGTHVAGTAGGNIYGVAKQARLISVKVYGPNGDGTTAGIIAGLNFVAKAVATSRLASVVNMSLGTSPQQGVIVSLDDATAALPRLGIHVVVSAGNYNVDAANTSPARAAGVITVGATTIADTRWPSSNFGPIVDIFAPGDNVISAGIAGPNSNIIFSGTSMAAPHVAGIVATLLSRDGNVTPAIMRAKVNALGLKNVIAGIPAGTVNLLAHIQ